MTLIYLRSGCHRDGNRIRAQLHFLCLTAPKFLTCRKRSQTLSGVVHSETIRNSHRTSPLALTFLGHYTGCYMCSVLEADLMLVNHENCRVPKIIALDLGIAELPLDLTFVRLQERDLILVPLFTAL